FLVPFFWPQNKPFLQLLCGGVVILLLIDRALIFLVPLKLGHAIDSFSVNSGKIPYREVVTFASLWILESSGGIPQLRKCMWSPCEEHFCFKIGTAAFDKIMSLPGDFHDKTNAANLWESVSQVIGARYLVRSFVFHIVPSLVDVLVAFAVLYWMFGMYMAMTFSAIIIAAFWVSGKMLPRLLGRQGQLIRDMEAEHKCLYEATSNWPGVVYFNRIQHEKLRYRAALADRMYSSIAFSFDVFLEFFAWSCLLYAGSTGLFILAAYQIAWENKPIGGLVTLVFYWTRLSSHLQLLPSIFRDSALGIVNTCDLVARLRVEPSIRNQKDAKPLVVNRGNLKFQDVSFCYYAEKRVLNHISFEAQAGQTIGLVGASGSGKSTLSKLLVRMYDPHPGIITIDGQNIQDVTLESLRNSIGIVSQEPIILHDTVMNNIRYADVLASEAKVYEACKDVGLHDLFNSLPEGYQTFLGGHGVKLSSGEQQCIAVARMIIKNPKVVFLDEATSNLDRHTESAVLRSFKKLCTGRITFIVSSRLSAVSGADKILVLHHGRLIEQGDHASLMSANGYYSRLWSSQV
ncbi:P-loop containing nucleoside triphosphate hydrolase protein, partial [Aspergillus steynii IBT 23096]